MRRKGSQYDKAINLVCNQSKADIDAYAERSATSLGLTPGGDLVPIIQQLGGRIHYRSGDEADGDPNTIYVHGPNEFDIVLPVYSTPRRDRFTIAHELGHYFLHSWMGKRPLQATRLGSDRAEWEANWFAAGLLMPRQEFTAAKREGLSIDALAQRFGVSPEAARVRCKVIGSTQG
ncbi:MAG: ImmA/IrrE family metallo-endopeptidase [bacterium]|jgi:Zn-dependent peptidase ImmA (M78 family)|nr:ImmA/IrrE family metallo-endopeptidase [Phycisphaerales bacterium]MCE2654282.1 ImmA/IrrE family metallo-endopeptidase [Planctomycetaceae bacterium]